ncbi:MAG: ankyrin repeat protein [Burkholderiaceae bacterium]|jgi:ankyrin repeat protein
MSNYMNTHIKNVDIQRLILTLFLALLLMPSLAFPTQLLAQTVFPSTTDDNGTQPSSGAAPEVANPSAAVSSNTTQEQFWTAIKQDDVWALSNAIYAGASPTSRLTNGNTALHQAVDIPSPDTAAMLMRQPGIDINARNNAGETPLMLAVLRGQIKMVHALVSAKAAVNHPGWTALHYAASATYEQAPEMIALLLDNFAYIDAESPNATTPLMMAARYGSSPNVAVLLESGADPRLKNQQGLNALDFATAGAMPDSIAMLSEMSLKIETLPAGTW